MLLYAKFNSNKFEGISEMQIKGREDVNVEKKKKEKKIWGINFRGTSLLL